MPSVRLAVIGDSFAEGVGDELADGSVRGWGDLVAQGWANAIAEPIEYLNLAIRGKLAWQIIDEQLDVALAQLPTHLAFNGGGNDLIRPRVDIRHVADAFARVIRRCSEAGVQAIIISGPNPSSSLPFGKTIQRRGDEISRFVGELLRENPQVIAALNWPDKQLSQPAYWSPDRLHLNAQGHHRVAARVLHSLGIEAEPSWWTANLESPGGPTGLAYYREFFVPWLSRRLRGRSSGDGRPVKYATWTARHPE
jgi:lysophospholipase L1-like esterase